MRRQRPPTIRLPATGAAPVSADHLAACDAIPYHTKRDAGETPAAANDPAAGNRDRAAFRPLAKQTRKTARRLAPGPALG